MEDLEKFENNIRFYFVRDHIPGAFPPAFEVFIHNNSKEIPVSNLRLETFSLVEETTSAVSKKEFGDLNPGTIISIDKSDVYELDFLIIYRLFFQSNEKNYKIELGIKGSPEGEQVGIPQSNLSGVRLIDFKVSEVE